MTGANRQMLAGVFIGGSRINEIGGKGRTRILRIYGRLLIIIIIIILLISIAQLSI